MKEQNPHCLICLNENVVPSIYDATEFNKRQYQYYACPSCRSVSIFPFPDRESLSLMYNDSFHPYLNEFRETELLQLTRYKKHTAQRIQLDDLKNLPSLGCKGRLLDFGCGGGIYMLFARSIGFDVTGIEFSSSFADIVCSKTGLEVYALEEFRMRFREQKFDVIHFGHCLEHLEDPYLVLESLKPYMHPETFIVIDGPIEINSCLSRNVINFFTRIRKKRLQHEAPYHLSFTTFDSQLKFFSKAGLMTLKYKTSEQFWPLPETAEWTKPKSLMKHLLARISIFFSGFFRKQGNVFHFVGKFTGSDGI